MRPYFESIPEKPRSFDFCFVNLDYTLVRVEEGEGGVTIRATADTFSQRRKNCFIRELAAEGFISDDRWFSAAYPTPCASGVRWLIDESWVRVDPALLARNHRLVKRFILPAALLWLGFMYVALSGQGRTGFFAADTAAPRISARANR